MLHSEWDSSKARSNLAKHGVSFEEASTIFGDFRAITVNDPKHSLLEKRYITLGCSYHNRILVVVHTERAGKVRIISSRPASRKERYQYDSL